MDDRKREPPSDSNDPRTPPLIDDRRHNRDEEQDHSTAEPRRNTRSEVDDYAPGPREEDSERGPLQTEHSEANPGGTHGEHSGQRPPQHEFEED